MDQHYYYEVIRIKPTCILYLDNHLERLYTSVLGGTGKKIDMAQVKQSVMCFLKQHGLRNQNIKIKVSESLAVDIDYIDSIYPEADAYQQGVRSKTLIFNRQNPHVKQRSDALFSVRQRIKDENIHDFILVNTSNCITEGTKTNVMFIKDGALIVPNRQQALLGITMQCVLKAASKVIKVLERDVLLTELGQMDAAFFTGTSIGMLPIRQIDDFLINSVQCEAFAHLREQYLRDERLYCTLERDLDAL